MTRINIEGTFFNAKEHLKRSFLIFLQQKDRPHSGDFFCTIIPDYVKGFVIWIKYIV